MIYSFVLLYSDDKKQPFYLTCDSIEEARQQCSVIVKDYRKYWQCIVLQPVRKYSENN